MKKREFLWPNDGSKWWPEIWLAEWDDPSSETQKVWMSPEDVKKTIPLPCVAAGLLIERTKTTVKLAVTACSNGMIGQIISLPLKGLNFFGKVAEIGRPGKEKKAKKARGK
jgi:hypothetical protein